MIHFGTAATPTGSCPAVEMLNAWPSTRFAAASTAGGRFVAKSGIASVSGESATPRSSMPMRKRNRPCTLLSLVVRLEKEIAPVRCARTRQVAVAVWPGAMLPSSIVSSLSSTPPLRLAPLRVTLT